MVDGIPDDRARRLAGRIKRIPFQKHAILQELEEERDVDIRRETGERSDNLFYQLRQDGNGKWLFVCHVNRKRKREPAGESVGPDPGSVSGNGIRCAVRKLYGGRKRKEGRLDLPYGGFICRGQLFMEAG